MANQPVEPENFREDLAVQFHELMCHDNHTDGCGWYYEKDWTGWAHKRYLDRATYVIENATNPDFALVEEVKIFIEAMRKLH